MSPWEFLELTPREINWMIQAHNSERKERNRDIYNLAVLVANGINAPKKFPSFEKFYPDAASKATVQSHENTIKDRLSKRGFEVN